MKKIPAVLLFVILLVNTAGFYVYYVIALQRIHREMRAQLRTLPDEQLSRLVLSRKTYKTSLVEADEIKVNEKMYDVARIELRGDSVIVLAMHDKTEENFLAFANEIISKPFKQDSNVTGSILQFISLDFLPGQYVNNFSSYGRMILHHSFYLFPANTSLLQHEAPPPRACS